MRLRALSWHVADVPGVQGYWELRSLKVWKFSFYAAPSVAPQGRSVLCSPFSGRPCRPSPAGALLHLLNLLCAFASPSGTSQTCRGCRENFSLPGRGAAPHTFQSLILPILLCSLWLLVPFVENSLAVLRALARPQSATNLLNLRLPFWQSFVSFVVLRVLCECRAAFGLIVAGGDCPGFNLWGSSKPPNFQASKQKKGPRADARGPLGKSPGDVLLSHGRTPQYPRR